MRKGRPGPSELWIRFTVPMLCSLLLCTGCATPRQRYEPESILRLNRSPAPHVGRAVILQGVTVQPQSGNRDGDGRLGEYLLRDSAGQTIRVLTRRVPGAGISCRVSGFVGQTPGNALLPLILEVKRSRPSRDLSVILGLLVLVVGSVPPAVIHHKRLQRCALPGSGPELPTGDGPPVLPGVAYALDLVVVAGPDTGKRHTFQSNRILVGRPGLRRNDLSLDDQTVSRKQAVILRDEKIGGYKIRNEGRTNPLKVNGRPCDAVALRDGDLLIVGLTTLQVRYREMKPPGVGSGGSRLPMVLLAVLLSAAGALPVCAGPEGSVSLEQLDLSELPNVTCRFRIPAAPTGSRLGLGPDDFRLMVDGRSMAAAELRSVPAPGQQLPRLALVVQASREDRGRGLFLLKSAISGFLERMPDSVPAALISQGTEVRVEQGFTADRLLLLEKLEAVPLGIRNDPGGYYAALDRAAGLISKGEPGPSAVIYFCRPGAFTREDMDVGSPKGLRTHPGIPIYPVIVPEREGTRTAAYLRRLTLKLTEGFTGHYTLKYMSPGGEDNRVHSLRIDRISHDRGRESACRYRAVTGSGLNAGDLLAAAERRTLLGWLACGLLGLLGGGLAFRWIVGVSSSAGSQAIRRSRTRLRLHFLAAGGLSGILLCQLISRLM